MKFFSSTKQASSFLKKGSVVAIGNFDGIHTGHRELLKRIFFMGKKLGLPTVALSFTPHPVRVLAPQAAPLMINTTKQKRELLEKLGMDATVLHPFDKRFAKISPETFFNTHLINNLKAKHIVVGYDFTFGAKRSGTIETLERLAVKNGITVDIVDAVLQKQTLVSSSLVRKFIQSGDITKAATLLERPFFIDGVVVHGHHRGEKLGIHTANLKSENELLPLDGVYATLTRVGNDIVDSVTNIGFNPTFNNRTRSIETHLLGFSKNLYRKNLRVLFIQRLRNEVKFESPQKLVAQIKKDIAKTKIILKKYRETSFSQ